MEAGQDRRVFRVHVLLRATYRVQGRAVALLQLLMACFDLFKGGASLRGRPPPQTRGHAGWNRYS
jgi:hypothetical protein